MTQLSPGGLAVLGFDTTGTGADFSFVLLSGVEAGTEIYFTDTGTRDGSAVFDNTNSAEGTLVWTAPTDLPAGSVINYATDIEDFTQPAISGIGGSNQPIELNIGGEQLIAFQGNLVDFELQDPSFIYAVSTYRDTFQGTGDGREGDTSSVNQTGVPAGLTEGETAIALGEAETSVDSVLYVGPTTGSKAELLAALADVSNWSRTAGSDQTQITADFTVTDATSNEDPGLTLPGAVTLDEDTLTAITGISVSDPENDTVTMVLTAAATLDVTASGTVIVTGSGTESVTIVGLVADVNATVASLTLTPPQDSNEAITLSVEVSDKPDTSTLGTVEITVTPVDDSPQIEYLVSAESPTPAAEITNGDLAATPLAFGTRFIVVDPDETPDSLGDFDLVIGYGASGSAAADLLTIATTLAPESGGTNLEGISTEVNKDNGATDVFVTETAGKFLIGTVDLVEDGTGGTDLRIALDAVATIDRVTVLLEALRFGNPAASPGTRDLTLQLSREVTPGVFETSDLDTFVVTITAGNVAPVLADVATSVTFDPTVVGTTPQVVDADVTLTDADSADFDGGSLTIAFSDFRPGASTVGEELSFDVSGDFSIAGTDLSHSGTVIGTISENGLDGNALSVDFTSATATPAVIEQLIEALRYRNTATVPETTREVNITVADGDGATSVAQTVAIVVETVTPPDREVTYTEDLGNVLIDDLLQFTADGADGDQTVYAGGTLAITMTGPGASDGLTFLSVASSDRFLVPDGEIFITPSGNVYLRDGDDVAGFVRFGTATGNETRSLTLTFDTSETFVFPDGFGASARRPTAEEVEQIVRALQYTNSEGDNPTEGTRTVEIVLTDATTTAEPTETFTVEVVAVEDDPVLSAINDTVTLDYAGGVPVTPATFNGTFDVADPDTTDFAGGEFRVSARTTTAEDNFSIVDGNGITVAGDQVSFGGNVIGTVSGGAAGTDLVVSLSGIVSISAAETLGLQVAYLNSSATPQPERDIAYTLADGNGGEAALVVQTLKIINGPTLQPPVIADVNALLTPLATDMIAGPVVLDADVTLSDEDMSGFDGGSLLLQYGSARGALTDQISILNGSGGVGIEVSGPTVSFDGAAFGTIGLNGVDGEDLEIAFSGSDATGAAVEALIEALQYQSTVELPTGTTDFFLTVTDADGQTSDQERITVTVLDNGIAVDDTATVFEDVGLSLSFDDLLDNDLNFNAEATIASVQDAVGGSVRITGETVFFSPTLDTNGPASFTYTASDGTWTSTATISIDVIPVNDPALFGGDVTGTITEAGGLNNAFDPDDGVITGTLTATDVDNTDNSFISSSTAASNMGYGTYSIDAGGAWTYTLANDNPAVEALANGASLRDSFTVVTEDLTAKTVSIMIEGADDFSSLRDTIFAETGTLALTQIAETITLQRSYDNPVVIAYVATENGIDPVNVRINDVSGNDLTLRLQEPNYLSGGHKPETVNYMVVEAGTWILPDGTILEAGTLNSNLLSSQGGETVAFDAAFDAAPVVLSQTQTANGGDFVTTRQRNADQDGFQLTMQEEEARNTGNHLTETIGWVAVEAGSGTAGDVSWLAGSTFGVTDADTTIELGTSTPGGANVIATLSSFENSDSAWARGSGSTTTSFNVSVEEDASRDAETVHEAESVDYFAFNQAGLMSAAPIEAIAETGTLTLDAEATTITLQRSYDDPVVVAYVATENDVDPVNVRISQVSGNDLTLQLQEPDYLDNLHADETVNYMVVEAGTWVLPDGTLLEAGTLNSTQLSTDPYLNVAFNAPFDTASDAAFNAAPVVLSQVQTLNGPSFVTTRQRNADTDGFELTLQEEEALNGSGHATESIGWIAIGAGSGTTGGFSWQAGRESSVTDATTQVALEAGLADDANVIAVLSSFVGPDTAWARGTSSTATSFDVSVEEETSLDIETRHKAEAVDYFAFDGVGLIGAYDYDFLA